MPGAKSDFSPASQISNNWLFAQERFKSRAGRDLLATLVAGGTVLADIPAYLGSTWPGGADSGFAKRYAANLAALQMPEPTEVIVTLGAPVTLQGVDGSGKPVAVVVKLAAAAAAGWLLLAPAPAPPDAAPIRPQWGPGFDWSASTFRFGHDAAGHVVTIPLAIRRAGR